jgi:hypothetical protein
LASRTRGELTLRWRPFWSLSWRIVSSVLYALQKPLKPLMTWRCPKADQRVKRASFLWKETTAILRKRVTFICIHPAKASTRWSAFLSSCVRPLGMCGCSSPVRWPYPATGRHRTLLLIRSSSWMDRLLGSKKGKLGSTEFTVLIQVMMLKMLSRVVSGKDTNRSSIENVLRIKILFSRGIVQKLF